jgi:DNA repair protein RadC
MKNEEDDEEEEHMHNTMGWPMKREFKLAMLDKKEKILKIKLEFIGKMKAMIEKMPEGK